MSGRYTSRTGLGRGERHHRHSRSQRATSRGSEEAQHKRHMYVDQRRQAQWAGHARPPNPVAVHRGESRKRTGVYHRDDISGMKRHRVQYLNQADIETLAQSNSQTIVRCIYENEPGFLAAYSHKKYCTHPLQLKHLVTILSQLIKSNDKPLASRIMAQVFSADGDYALFVVQFDKLIKEMSAEKRVHIRQENPRYIKYILDIGLFAIQHIPQTVLYIFPVESIKVTIDSLIRNGEHLDTLAERAKKLVDNFTSARDEQHVCQESEAAVPFPDPPEHFTQLPVLPNVAEVQAFAQKPYIRPNIVRGSYHNWDHYLDIQFRLFREDFVAPLRDGIAQRREGKTPSDVHVYENVCVLQPVCLFSGVGFQIRLDNTLKGVNWEHSKRLIYGSLLCLSQNDFKTIAFATVVKRDAKLLEEGLLTIKFEDGTDGFQIDPSVVYNMVESNAYFEAYRHILEGLQNLSRKTETLPFKQYIVDCQLQNIPLPSYLRSSGRPVFNLKDTLSLTLKDFSSASNSLSDVALTVDFSQWPPCELTCFDRSQYKAFGVALTQELSVIQGPPGTGKTYVGLKIIEAFLKNRNVWDKYRTSPICVVCYTNHALDQFLEGIKETKIDGKEPNIVRIGGRCKTESLKTCILKQKVDSIRAQKALPKNLAKNLEFARIDLFKAKQDIDQVQSTLELNDGELFSMSSLEGSISPHHYDQLANGMLTDAGKELEVWLGLWVPQYVVYSTEAIDPVISLHNDSQGDLVQPEKMECADENIESDIKANLLQVDAEAYLLEEQRILEGEELELEPSNLPQNVARPKKAVHSQGHDVLNLVSERKITSEGYMHKPMSEHEARQVSDIWSLSQKQRWKLYNLWVTIFTNHKKKELARIGRTYNEACEYYHKCQREVHMFVMRGADIVGITTTGAAKHQNILNQVFPKIVIIEEAAEVFEAHIVSSLAPSVQQLIMIGDHKQLRPKPNCFELEKNYGLDISLFERLAMNRINFVSLEVQHRMRPQIADLIRPCIYSSLTDHVSVTAYDTIIGVGKNLFAIAHDVPETSTDKNDLRSHANLHEAEYLVALCKYLLKQGYESSQITLLTMYRGQLLELKKRMKRADFQGVRIAVVDDFQGEENDIILLSLVRSNSEGNIGFLKAENRVCVSLSRAKKGLFIIGNFAMFRNKCNTVWPEIVSALEQKQCIGNALPLNCPLHPEQTVAAQNPQDFLKCPEGGCQQKCGTRLLCGHTCSRLCHPYDRGHKMYTCKKQCGKILSCGHQCKFKCSQCTNGCCQPCSETSEKTSPRCGHIINMLCSEDPASVKCSMLCVKRLPCGHVCQEVCSSRCTTKCCKKTKKTLACGHQIETSCFNDPENIQCQKPCNGLLDCGHKCTGTCGKCRRGRLHIPCQSKCGRVLVCGHCCEFPCTPNCPPCLKKCNNYCVHSKCPKRCYELCVPCMEPCKWKCKHFECTRPCGQPCNRPPCNSPCMKTIKCGHACIGLCGETCPDKCRICDRDELCEVFFGNEDEPDARFIQLQDCHHVFEVEGLDTWMSTTSEDAPKEVQFKVCPKCKAGIRKSLRYGNVIKQSLSDHEAIKQKQLESCKDDIKQQVNSVKDNLEHLSSYGIIAREIEKMLQPSSSPLIPHHINAIKRQLSLLPHIVQITHQLNAVAGQWSFSTLTIKVNDTRRDLLVLLKFFMRQFPSEQQMFDAQCELRRLSCITKLCDLSSKLAVNKVKLETSDEIELNRMAREVYESGVSNVTEKLSDSKENEVCALITRISERYKVNGLTEKQKIEIVKAVGLSKGHWFKCPNGHFYAIGECGGAMEESKCPECGAKIGGQRHTLTAGNEHAPEMDNSQHAAWSEAGNLRNFDPLELNRLVDFA